MSKRSTSMQFFRQNNLAVTTALAILFSIGSAVNRPTITPLAGREVRSSKEPVKMNGMQYRRENTFRKMMQAVNAGDAKAYASLYATDATIEIVGGDILRGRGAIENYEIELLKQFPGVEFRITDLWLDGESGAVARYGVNGKALNGKLMGHEGLLFYEFDEAGLITKEDRYLDSITPMAQVGALNLPFRALPYLPTTMTVHIGKPTNDEIALKPILIKLVGANGLANGKSWDSVFARASTLDDMTEVESRKGLENIQDWFNQRKAAVKSDGSIGGAQLATSNFLILAALIKGELHKNIGFVQGKGQTVSYRQAWVFEFKDGKVSRATAFMNFKEFAASAGAWPPPAK